MNEERNLSPIEKQALATRLPIHNVFDPRLNMVRECKGSSQIPTNLTVKNKVIGTQCSEDQICSKTFKFLPQGTWF